MKKMALAVLAAGAVLCVRAEAVTYTFTPTSIGPQASLPLYTLDTPAFMLVIDDTAVRSGSFFYDYRYGYISTGNSPTTVIGPIVSGDVQALQLFQANDGRISFSGGGGGSALLGDYITINLRFTASGQISSAQVILDEDVLGINLSGTSDVFGGRFFVGNLPPDTVLGSVSGSLPNLATVPEPASLALLTFGVALLSLRRRSRSRRARHVEGRVVGVGTRIHGGHEGNRLVP